jgi:hypothetical protein
MELELGSKIPQGKGGQDYGKGNQSLQSSAQAFSPFPIRIFG